MTVNEEDVTGLLATLEELTLPPGQRELLNAILKVVADIQENFGGQAFTGEFSDAFTKKHADLVMEYVTPHPGVASAIIRNPGASPAGIIKTPPPAPDADDNEEDNEKDDNDKNDEQS